MSLFPAYAEKPEKEEEQSNEPKASKWLQNNSFPLKPEEVENVIKPPGDDIQKPDEEPMEISSTDEEDSSNKSHDEDKDCSKSKKSSKKKKKHKKKSKRKEMKEKMALVLKEQEMAQQQSIIKDSDEFYKDTKAITSYIKAETLYRPACPKYKLATHRKLGDSSFRLKKSKVKRYFKEKYDEDEDCVVRALNEEDFLSEQGKLNRKVLESPSNLEVWLDYIKLQDKNPYKWPRLFLAEKKMDLVHRALKFHPSNDTLYRAYIEAITDTFPAFEAAKLLDKMLSKDPYSYVLWTAQIMTTQGSMARCVVPEVLRIYEKCMQKMHHAQKKNKLNTDSDWMMLKLFNNCAMFLRQAGLQEQFFALIKLALELNVSPHLFGNFAPKDEEQNILIEFEEVILQSGLPMNEIWLRIEKLRQGFNFLPLPENSKSSDPQRIVFNEDVCHYIYPLKEKENSFFLMLLIVRLLKVPFIQSDVLTGKFLARVEHIGDSDAIEDMLSICLRRTFVLPLQEHDQFLSCLVDVAKEMASTPSFLSNNIGYEIYVRTLNEMLLNCAEAFEGINERKRTVFLSLWCKFERLLLVLNKLQGKLTPDYVKGMKVRFKNLLKQKASRNSCHIFTEYLTCLYEAMDEKEEGSLEAIRKLFETTLDYHYGNDGVASELSHVYLVYAEILIGCKERETALEVLVAYATNTQLSKRETFGSAKKLAAVQKLKNKVESLMKIEEKVEIMVLEQYLLPDHTVNVLKMYCFLLSLMGQKAEALEYLEKLLKIFRPDENDRQNFLRENITELEIILLQLPIQSSVITHMVLNKKITQALASYPRNLFFLQTCGMLTSIPSYQLKRAMLSSPDPTVQAVTFFIASHRLRFIKNRSQNLLLASEDLNQLDILHNETIVRYRILNMFKDFTTKISKASASSSSNKDKYNTLRRNALFWRFYLRCISDKQTSFDVSKNCLLMALDECPWNKALYLDGATFVPQELHHLQDLIIEKHLRIYALPEELEILREH